MTLIEYIAEADFGHHKSACSEALARALKPFGVTCPLIMWGDRHFGWVSISGRFTTIVEINGDADWWFQAIIRPSFSGLDIRIYGPRSQVCEIIAQAFADVLTLEADRVENGTRLEFPDAR